MTPPSTLADALAGWRQGVRAAGKVRECNRAARQKEHRKSILTSRTRARRGDQVSRPQKVLAPVLRFKQECSIHIDGPRHAGYRTGELPNRDELAEKSSAMFVIMADGFKPAAEKRVQPLEETIE
jgi:hypothetical protein